MSSPDGGGVVITLADIYRQLIALTTRVDSALAKQDRDQQVLAEHEMELRPLAGAAEKLVDHETRLRSLERSRWPLASLAALIPLAALAVAILVAVYGPAAK
jgi:hypothetical protein